jgi:type II secretory pathway pseudopilin PulG
MLRFQSRRTAGFTLVELAIVVGITGLLFSGLWRLMSSGNSQLREQAAADQLNQIANATRSFLSSAQGQAMLRAPDATAAPAVFALPLPVAAFPAGNAGCAAGLGDAAVPPAGIGAYCAFLPAGFNVLSTNSYNQTYTIIARKLDGAATVSPQNFDFMIMTNGGDIIGDNSGGRISANIGANGGFIYSAATCPAAIPVVTNACGAFGGFTFDPAWAAAAGGFAAANPGAGHIVTLNSKGGDNALTGFWLARPQIPGDVNFGFNTMVEDLRMGANGRLGTRFTNIEMGFPLQAGLPAGQINMRNGTLNLNDGTAVGNLANLAINLENGVIQGPGQITLNNPAITGQSVVVNDIGSPNNANTVEIFHSNNLGNALFLSNQPGGVGGPWDCSANPIACTIFAETVLGNVSVNGVIVATSSAAGSFIYQSDRDLKRDLTPIPHALDRLTKLNGYQFMWKSSGRADLGVVAQEVRDVFPELVVGKEGTGQMGVEYGNLVAPIIEAIKELKIRNEQLQHEVAAQAKEIAALKQEK